LKLFNVHLSVYFVYFISLIVINQFILTGTSKMRQFNNAQKYDSGLYSCTASNMIGGQTKTDSKSIQVNVLCKC